MELPPEKAEEQVLTGLGNPERLAAGYADRPLHLIGPGLYLEWLRVLRLLLGVVPSLAVSVVAIVGFVSRADAGRCRGGTFGCVMYRSQPRSNSRGAGR